ncbi:MAG: CoA transferase [Sphingobium sp.]
MKRALAFARKLCGEIARHGPMLDARAVLDRGDALSLARPGLFSANRSCRLIAAADGWVALNLARGDDRDLVSAWLEQPADGACWPDIARAARHVPVAILRARAAMLGLPLSVLGEAAARLPEERQAGTAAPRRGPLRVVDLSSLWAGPLCASILAQAGAQVVKVESMARRDTTPASAPALDARLNGAKGRVALDFADPAARAELTELIAGADVLVTNARARAFPGLGLAPDALFAANPALIWVAITGHGWASERVAFGDDAAAAGGLVRRTRAGAPRFLGDAIADPLTGLAAARAALCALESDRGMFIDASMAGIAAAAAVGP